MKKIKSNTLSDVPGRSPRINHYKENNYGENQRTD